jgi:hypothetical protein
MAFQAFKKEVNPRWLVGAYCSGYIGDRLAADGAIDSIGGLPLIWLTDSLGFRGTRASIDAGRYIMIQGLPRNTVSFDTDPNWLKPSIREAKIDYIGVCVPEVPGAPNTASSLEWIQETLNRLDDAGLEVDGVMGGPRCAEHHQLVGVDSGHLEQARRCRPRSRRRDGTDDAARDREFPAQPWPRR